MGQNRRYDLVGRDLDRWERRHRAKAGEPLGLSPEQLKLTGSRRDSREPIPVEARVDHRVVYDEPLVVEAVAVAWTDDAVLVRWTPTGSRTPVERWVWANAVRRR